MSLTQSAGKRVRGERVTIGFGVTSDWMKKWHEFFEPIVKRTVLQNQLLLDTLMKTALFHVKHCSE